MKINDYYEMSLSEKAISTNAHRDAVGGKWEELGRLQFDFIKQEGLLPQMTLLDVGCGSLRGGLFFIDYLDKGNYFGIDLNKSLLDAGYDIELAGAGLQPKMPRENLLCDEHFAFARFGKTFDCALAQSVFSHLPLNHIRLCLINLEKCMAKGGRFYATFFQCRPEQAIERPIEHHPGSVITYPDRDPYHYKLDDIAWCIEGLSWEILFCKDWNHPKDQKMLAFRRI